MGIEGVLGCNERWIKERRLVCGGVEDGDLGWIRDGKRSLQLC